MNRNNICVEILEDIVDWAGLDSWLCFIFSLGWFFDEIEDSNERTSFEDDFSFFYDTTNDDLKIFLLFVLLGFAFTSFCIIFLLSVSSISIWLTLCCLRFLCYNRNRFSSCFLIRLLFWLEFGWRRLWLRVINICI